VVEGRLREGLGPDEVIRALFPCGSITGAPKLRAMEVIDEVEPFGRGLYTGSIGHIAPDGTARFNVAIRTISVESGARHGVWASARVSSPIASRMPSGRNAWTSRAFFKRSRRVFAGPHQSGRICRAL
jgi:hypothetical protein